MSRLSQNPQQQKNASGTALQQGRASGPGYLFGIPVGDLGWFATLLLGFAAGFTAFFAATFLGIMGILAFNTLGHHSVDFALSYKRLGFPFGLTVAVLSLGYLGSLWVRRQIRRA